MIGNPNAMMQPIFDQWQKMWMPQATQAVPQAQNPLGMWQQQTQQMQSLWLQGLGMTQQSNAPTAMPMGMPTPKITVTTIDFGDIRPYMEMASQMMAAFAAFNPSSPMKQWGQR